MIAVFIGAFFGAIARFELSQRIAHYQKTTFPFGTLIVNLIGCFFIGVLFQLELSNTWVLFCMTGFLGAFTTFSTFSLEIIQLLQAKRYRDVAFYVLATFVFGLSFTWLGFHL